MKFKSLTRAILGFALAAGISQAAIGAPITHASATIAIGATWHAGALTVSGAWLGNGDVIDIAVYNGAVFNTKPLATAVVTAQQVPCSPHAIWCIVSGATFATTFTTLNPGACDSINPQYQVIAYDQTAEIAGDIATVYPDCGTGQPTAPQSGGPTISASLNSATGVISVNGRFFTSQGPVAMILFHEGQPVSTVQLTASPFTCSSWICMPPSVSASFGTALFGCSYDNFTVVAVDEATRQLSNEVTLLTICPPQ